jgi:exodeoxyribonuclease VII large subunit
VGSSQLNFTFTQRRKIYSVSDLNQSVQAVFDQDFRSISVSGEISNCRQAASGHCYFALKDQRSQIKCVLFKSASRFLKFKPQDGLEVIARGSLEVYEARGEYQLLVEALEPQGAGALQIAFDKLKQKLLEEGLFAQERKKALPKHPARIGLITSPSGSVVRDILHVLERRFPGLHIRIYPVQVQGQGSAEQVCAGLSYFSKAKWADVVIVARGGGSLEDLWTFNEESVGRAIAASEVPVISAIGHETDFTISDFAADVRAATPSAAAEIVIATRDSLLGHMENCRAKLVQSMRYTLISKTRDLSHKGVDKTAAVIHRLLARRAQALDEADQRQRELLRQVLQRRQQTYRELRRRLEATDLRIRLSTTRAQQQRLEVRLQVALERRIWNARSQHKQLDLHLEKLSPLSILDRGYAIVEDLSGHVIRSAAETNTGASLRVRLSRGELGATVKDLFPAETYTES